MPASPLRWLRPGLIAILLLALAAVVGVLALRPVNPPPIIGMVRTTEIKIEPEVSQLDPSHNVTVGQGIVVPALTVRRASSTIELKDGQSFVLAGLLQNELSAAQQQLPWIGDVPVLGALFSSKAFQKNETDLIIIVTPRLVNPTRPGDVIKTPLSNTLPANDVDFFLTKNHPEVLRTEVRGGGAQVERGPVGHMLALPKGDVNAVAK